MKYTIVNEEYRLSKRTEIFSDCYDYIESTRAKTVAALRDITRKKYV